MNGANKSIVLLVLCVLTICGCGSGPAFPRSAVQGTVTVDGKPLPRGTIRFAPIEGTPGHKLSAEIEAGNFSLAAPHGPAAGIHRVEIATHAADGFEMDDEDILKELRESRAPRISIPQIHPRFNERSQLRAEILVDKTNVLHFEVFTKR